MLRFFILTLVLQTSPKLSAEELSLRDLFPPLDFLFPEESAEKNNSESIRRFCLKFNGEMKRYGWKVPDCQKFSWKVHSHTKLGNPLIYTEIGDGQNTTLIFSGVHPDELNPIPVAMRLLEELNKNAALFRDRKIVIAPLVNPDGFFRPKATRTNASGIDLNRNFNTLDWYSDAHNAWTKRNKRPRYFPGWLPESEIETNFQTFLIDKYKPQKLLSLHAPLGIIDYDLDYSLSKAFAEKNREKLKKFATDMAKNTNNYRIIDFNVYPGSLGNFAGVEKKIPTFTIELTDANPDNFEMHWKNVHKGLLFAISEGLKLSENEK
jgi:protein MpaA